MQKVNSFIVDHTRLKPGIYQTMVNGAYTYDVRFVAPQDAAHNGLFMTPKVAHTLEHFLADFLRTKADGLLSAESGLEGAKADGLLSAESGLEGAKADGLLSAESGLEGAKADGLLSAESGLEGAKADGSFSEKLLYVGPMGCLTGFYLLTAVPFEVEFLRGLILKAMEYILNAKEGEIPGASELTCGNWQYFDLAGTKDFIKSVIVPNFMSEEFCKVYPMLEE